MSLSSLQNGGLSGVDTTVSTKTPTYVQFNDVEPGTIGFDKDNSQFWQYRIRPAERDGHLLAYRPPGFQGEACNLYCAVDIDGELVWKPVMIYGDVINSSTGERFA